MSRQLIPFPASEEIENELYTQHHVKWEEVEEIFRNYPRTFLLTIADQYGEPRYRALGRTDAGRYLIVFYVFVPPNFAKVISARNMTSGERKQYRRK